MGIHELIWVASVVIPLTFASINIGVRNNVKLIIINLRRCFFIFNANDLLSGELFTVLLWRGWHFWYIETNAVGIRVTCSSFYFHL